MDTHHAITRDLHVDAGRAALHVPWYEELELVTKCSIRCDELEPVGESNFSPYLYHSKITLLFGNPRKGL